MNYKLLIILCILIIPTSSKGNVELFSEQYVVEVGNDWVTLNVPGDVYGWLNLTAAISNTTDQNDPTHRNIYERVRLMFGSAECGLGRYGPYINHGDEWPQDHVIASCTMKIDHTDSSGSIIYEKYPSYYTHYFPLEIPFDTNITLSMELNGTHGFFYINNFYMNTTVIYPEEYVPPQERHTRIDIDRAHYNVSNIWVVDYTYAPYQIKTIVETTIATETYTVNSTISETTTEISTVFVLDNKNSPNALPIPTYLVILALPIMIFIRKKLTKTV
ncbi:hypothetical protein LCGC14_0194830 [marine sediment metagenome]|uniref:Uncharacterized protein n=1 Tax=marine sediment metagenome TaxID=412755 RepID=A0A0F9X480_9ZZZZ